MSQQLPYGYPPPSQPMPLPPPRNRSEQEYERRYYAQWGMQPPKRAKDTGQLKLGLGLAVVGILLLAGISSNSGSHTTPTPDTHDNFVATSVAVNATATNSVATPTVLPVASTGVAGAPPTPPAPAAVAMISVVSVTAADSVNIRDAPSVNGAVLQTLASGQEVQSAATTTPGTDDGAAWLAVMYDRDRTGYVRADLVSAPMQRVAPTPTPVPPTLTPAEVKAAAATLAAVPTRTPLPATRPVASSSALATGQWVVSYSYIFTALNNDTQAVGDAASAQNLPRLLTACRVWRSDIQTAQSFPPIPDAQADRHFQAMLRDSNAAANDCVNGVTTGSAPLLQRMVTEVHAATADLSALNDDFVRIRDAILASA